MVVGDRPGEGGRPTVSPAPDSSEHVLQCLVNREAKTQITQLSFFLSSGYKTGRSQGVKRAGARGQQEAGLGVTPRPPPALDPPRPDLLDHKCAICG